MQKFFEAIPSGTNIDFIGRRKRYMLLSLILVIATFGLLAFNAFTRGSALNFGIDFQGGSQVRVALSKDVPIEDIRGALNDLGYEGSSVVQVPDAENEVMIRVKEVISISDELEATCKKAVDALPGPKLVAERGFRHPPDSSAAPPELAE